MSDDVFETKEGRAWVRRANETLRPMIEGSAVTVGLLSGSEPDAKQAVEIGFMVLMDKPIILAVSPGVKVPSKLALVADAIVEVDLDNDPDGSRQRIEAAMAAVDVP